MATDETRGHVIRRVSTGVLVFLLALLPLLTLILAQMNLEDEGGWREALAWLSVPTALAWVVVVTALVARGIRSLRRG